MPAGNPNAYNIPGDPSSGVKPNAMAQQNAAPNASFNRQGAMPAQAQRPPMPQQAQGPRPISQMLGRPQPRPMPQRPQMGGGQRPPMDPALISQLLQSVTRQPQAPQARRPF